jgi:cytochrome b
MSRKSAPPAAVPAWDLPTRLFHWTLVLLIASAWVSYEYAEELGDPTLVWHRWNGLAVLVLIVWRLLWGVAGSSTARFTSFVRGPTAAWRYARNLIGATPPHYLGHNPLGAAMVLALLLTIGIDDALGLFAVDDNDLTGGPLYLLVSEAANKTMTRWHAWSFYWVLLALIALHVTANVLYALVAKEPLIRAMITGEKPVSSYEDHPRAELVAHPLARATVCLLLAATLVFGAILLAGGRLI